MKKYVVVNIMIVTAMLCLSAESYVESWDSMIKKGRFVKTKEKHLINPYYQNMILGLGGTTMRVDTHGFGVNKAPKVGTFHYTEAMPYLGYEYWWDEEAHRHLPFLLHGGYGDELIPGAIKEYRQELDIYTGLLTVDLTLDVKEGTDKGGIFKSKREMFITPEGVLVMKITEPDAKDKLRLKVGINKDVRIYLNQGIYDKEHAPWSGSIFTKSEGMVVVAKREKSCMATLAVAVNRRGSRIDKENFILDQSASHNSRVFYIAPGSSYSTADPIDSAWKKVERARGRGYAALLKETSDWWGKFYNQSSVKVPDDRVMKLYAQSLYYHGVYFGNTEIPPGCNATSIESFAGAVCTEYDLVLSQKALLYTGHLEEGKRIAAWIGRTLPKAEKNATEGYTQHGHTAKYNKGALYGTLVGYDGTILQMPTSGEYHNIYSMYPSANCAMMVLDYLDFSMDAKAKEIAYEILRKSTEMVVQNLSLDSTLDEYLFRKNEYANMVNQSSMRKLIQESFARNIADASWEKYKDKIHLPTGEYNSQPILLGGTRATPVEGQGDATWLAALWYYGVISKFDERIPASYENNAKSKTGNYVFNNGWMGVIACKLFKADDALMWLKSFDKPGIIIFDETAFTENVTGSVEDYARTPEIGAHGTYLCNVTQMIVDPDHMENIDLFPAVNNQWRKKGISFENLLVKGNISVSGSLKADLANITLKNLSSTSQNRVIRIKLVNGERTLKEAPKDVIYTDNFALLKLSLPAKEEVKIRFSY